MLTTTTKMTVPPEGRRLPLALGRDDAFRAGALEDIRARGLASAVVGSGRGDRGRVLGISADWPRNVVDSGFASLVAVEADGSKGRPFKAPAAHEPVLPTGVDVVAAVVGVGVLGRPLDERSVHRPELVAAVAGASIGDQVTPELVAKVLASPNGGRKGVPDAASFVVLISSAARNPEGTEDLASACLKQGIARVAIWDASAEILRTQTN